MTYIYEKLDVWQKAMQFAGKTMDTVSTLNNTNDYRKILQDLAACCLKIPATIAAGKSHSSKHNFAKHLYQSRAALYETMTMLELLKQKQILSEDKFVEFDATANQIVAMLTNLVKSMYKPKNGSHES